MFETIISGVIVFVAGQAILKIVIEPIQQLHKTLGTVAHALVNYAPIFSNLDISKKEDIHEVYVILRKMSSQLHADMRQIPLYYLWSLIFFLPKKKAIYDGARKLITLSNWLYSNSSDSCHWIAKLRQEASENFNIFMYENEKVSKEMLDSIINKKSHSEASTVSGDSA